MALKVAGEKRENHDLPFSGVLIVAFNVAGERGTLSFRSVFIVIFSVTGGKRENNDFVWGAFWRRKRENRGLSFTRFFIVVLNVAGGRVTLYFNDVVIVVFNVTGGNIENSDFVLGAYW